MLKFINIPVAKLLNNDNLYSLAEEKQTMGLMNGGWLLTENKVNQ